MTVFKSVDRWSKLAHERIIALILHQISLNWGVEKLAKFE